MYFTAPGDYNVVNESLTFTPSMMRDCFNVTTVGDDDLEFEENLNLVLSSSDSNVILDPAMAIVTIDDDDRKCTQTNDKLATSI